MGHRLTLGIAIGSPEVPFWVARLIEDVRSDPNLELRAVLMFPSDVVGPGLLRACTLLAELKPYYRDRAKRENVRSKLSQAELVEFEPVPETGNLTPEQIARIRSLGLDILLNLTWPSAKGPILAAARYGVWEFVSRGAPVHNHPYVGFWEVYHSEPVTSIYLCAASPDGRKHRLGETQIATRTNLALTKSWALESAITLLRYAAQGLARNPSSGLESLTRSTDGVEQEVLTPSAGQVLRCAARGLLDLTTEELKYFCRKVQWSIGISNVPPLSLSTADLTRVLWLTPDPSRFFADPFLIEHYGRKFIFVEDYAYQKGKGVISVIELAADGRFSDPRPVLETDFHMSFPFVFQHDGRLYMVPEQSQSRQVVLYEAISFPAQWRQKTVLIDGFAGVDNALFEDRGSWWLFTTLGDHDNYQNNLHLFRSPTLFGHFEPHPSNPVKLGLLGSRMAGRVFRDGERIIRPAQNCMRWYGGSVVFQEILAIDETKFEERFVREVEPSPLSPFGMAFHTVNCAGKTTVVDGYRLFSSLARSRPLLRGS